MGPKSAKSAKYRAPPPGYFAGILTKPGYTWKYPSSFFLNFVRFASFRFCPRPALSTQTQTGTLREIEGKEGGTKTKNTLCFPSKFPETQSAGGAASVFLLFGKVRIQANQAEARAVEEHGWWRRRRRAGKSSRRSATRRRAELSRAREDLASEREEAGRLQRASVTAGQPKLPQKQAALTCTWSTWSAVGNLTSRAGGLRSAPSGPDDRDRVTG